MTFCLCVSKFLKNVLLLCIRFIYSLIDHSPLGLKKCGYIFEATYYYVGLCTPSFFWEHSYIHPIYIVEISTQIIQKVLKCVTNV
jgi:hypothetical protein